MKPLEAKSRIFSSRGKVITAALIGILVGFGSCYLYYKPQVENLNMRLSNTLEDLSTAEEKITQLQSELTSVQAEKSRLEELASSLNSSLTETIQKLSDKENELKKALEDLNTMKSRLTAMNETIAQKEEKIAMLNAKISTLEDRIDKIEEAISKLETDRTLLIYLRMELPETREAALEYWQRVKDISTRSDPRLGPLVDEIVPYIDAYYDWRAKMPGPDATKDEIADWLYELYFSPAINYLRAIDRFTREAYLVIITHIEALTE